MDTKGPISPASDGHSSIYVIVHAFTNYVVLHPSPRIDAANALYVLFDHWIVDFGIPDIIVTDNGNEFMNCKLHIVAACIMSNLITCTVCTMVKWTSRK